MKNCSPSRVKKYQGTVPPRCGCDACLKKYTTDPAGNPKMIVGKYFWETLKKDGEDMRWYRLNRSIPLRASQLFKQH